VVPAPMDGEAGVWCWCVGCVLRGRAAPAPRCAEASMLRAPPRLVERLVVPPTMLVARRVEASREETPDETPDEMSRISSLRIITPSLDMRVPPPPTASSSP